MRLLLDENLDWRLRRDLLDHQVESVPLIGWAGIENGELLADTRPPMPPLLAALPQVKPGTVTFLPETV
jgi:hypothetical protein